jgi:hypothetical protein
MDTIRPCTPTGPFFLRELPTWPVDHGEPLPDVPNSPLLPELVEQNVATAQFTAEPSESVHPEVKDVSSARIRRTNETCQENPVEVLHQTQ